MSPMAFMLPNLSSPALLVHPSEKPAAPHPHVLTSPCTPPSHLSPLTKPDPSPVPFRVTQLSQALHVQDLRPTDNDFYVNLRLAVRTLRDDLPHLFARDLNYHIYRDDIAFVDPLNKFIGIDNYKLIFWTLRLHGRIFFREIWLEVFRVWQPSENVILIRWNLRGVPRVPWEADGEFQGTSRYKVDRNGKIYEHKVDNLAFNCPPAAEACCIRFGFGGRFSRQSKPYILVGPASCSPFFVGRVLLRCGGDLGSKSRFSG